MYQQPLSEVHSKNSPPSILKERKPKETRTRHEDIKGSLLKSPPAFDAKRPKQVAVDLPKLVVPSVRDVQVMCTLSQRMSQKRICGVLKEASAVIFGNPDYLAVQYGRGKGTAKSFSMTFSRVAKNEDLIKLDERLRLTLPIDKLELLDASVVVDLYPGISYERHQANAVARAIASRLYTLDLQRLDESLRDLSRQQGRPLSANESHQPRCAGEAEYSGCNLYSIWTVKAFGEHYEGGNRRLVIRMVVRSARSSASSRAEIPAAAAVIAVLNVGNKPRPIQGRSRVGSSSPPVDLEWVNSQVSRGMRRFSRTFYGVQAPNSMR